MELEDRVTISTPEGVDVELVVAGLGSRFMSSTVDTLLQALLIIPFLLVAAVGSEPAVGLAVASVGGFIAIFGFPTVFDAFFGGRTPGRRMAGLRLVTTDGATVGFVPAAVRNIVRVVDFLPGGYAVGTFSCLFTERTQRLGDLAAGTLVVRADPVSKAKAAVVPGARRADAPTPPGGGPWASPTGLGAASAGPALPVGWDLTAIGEAELAVMRSFLERRHGLDPTTRAKLAHDLASRIGPMVVGPDRGHGDEAFLESVVTVKEATGR